MWWGHSLPNLRWSLLISVVTLISLIINYNRLKPLNKADYSLIFWLAGLSVWMYFVSAFYAVDPTESFKRAEDFCKFTAQAFLMMFLIRNIKEYKVVIWTFIVNVSNFGRIAFERGSNRYLGVTAPNAGEENAVAAHVCSMIPFFGLYFLTGNKWVKTFTLLSLPFLLNLIILSNSRASFLTLSVLGLLTFFWVRGRLRWRVFLSLLGAFFLVTFLANDTFWERQKTVLEYQAEGSAMSRYYLWQGALRVALDHPMGVGGEGFEALATQYVPELAETMEAEGVKSIHNTFLSALTEWGFVGFTLFVGFLIHTFVILQRIRRDGMKEPKFHCCHIDAVAIQLGLIGILIAGFFHNRYYAEVVYWFAAFAVALRNIQVDEMLTERKRSEVIVNINTINRHNNIKEEIVYG
jgi:probable O-glycosylation ligase (exosortase A-associated)